MDIDWSSLNRTSKLRGRAFVVLLFAALFSPLPLIAVLLGLGSDVRACLPDAPRGSYCDPLSLLALAGACLSLLLLPAPFLWMSRASKFIRVLRDRPQRVVWLYVEGTVWKTYALGVRVGDDRTSSAIVGGLDDGSTVRLEVRESNESLFEMLAARLNGAALGYSDERLRTFSRNPSELRVPTLRAA